MNKRVLVVDDEYSILVSVRELLEPEGFEVITVDSGRGCIEELKKGFKGVILMDIMMPGLDGWDTIKWIVDGGFLEGNIIAMLTARDTPDKKMEYVKEYVIDYIRKPFEPDQLVTAVKEYFTYLNSLIFWK